MTSPMVVIGERLLKPALAVVALVPPLAIATGTVRATDWVGHDPPTDMPVPAVIAGVAVAFPPFAIGRRPLTSAVRLACVLKASAANDDPFDFVHVIAPPPVAVQSPERSE